jgi:hypothetical protein
LSRRGGHRLGPRRRPAPRARPRRSRPRHGTAPAARRAPLTPAASPHSPATPTPDGAPRSDAPTASSATPPDPPARTPGPAKSPAGPPPAPPSTSTHHHPRPSSSRAPSPTRTIWRGDHRRYRISTEARCAGGRRHTPEMRVDDPENATATKNQPAAQVAGHRRGATSGERPSRGSGATSAGRLHAAGIESTHQAGR